MDKILAIREICNKQLPWVLGAYTIMSFLDEMTFKEFVELTGWDDKDATVGIEQQTQETIDKIFILLNKKNEATMSQQEFHELHFTKMEEIKRKIFSFNQITGSNIDPETAPLIAKARMKVILDSDEIWKTGEYAKHLQQLVDEVC